MNKKEWEQIGKKTKIEVICSLTHRLDDFAIQRQITRLGIDWEKLTDEVKGLVQDVPFIPEIKYIYHNCWEKFGKDTFTTAKPYKVVKINPMTFIVKGLHKNPAEIKIEIGSVNGDCWGWTPEQIYLFAQGGLETSIEEKEEEIAEEKRELKHIKEQLKKLSHKKKK